MAQTQKTNPTASRKYSKQAFIDSASTSKERYEYEVVLQQGETYTRAEAEKAIQAWKKKGVK